MSYSTLKESLEMQAIAPSILERKTAQLQRVLRKIRSMKAAATRLEANVTIASYQHHQKK